jgi:outer membrane protein assembly factor BamB
VSRKFLIILDVVAALVIVGGIVGVAVVFAEKRTGPKPTPFPSQAVTQSTSPSPGPSQPTAVAPILGNWPTYGYDLARTRFDPEVALTPPFRVKWRWGAGDLLEFPPSVYAGSLYVNTQHGSVICLNARNKLRRWIYTVPNAEFASTPTVTAKSVYVTTLAGHLIVLNRETGRPRWGIGGLGRTESSPLVYDGRVFFGDESGYLYAVSIKTHRIVWKYNTGGAVKGAPAELNGRIVVGSYSGAVFCLNVDGRLLWRTSTGGLFGSDQFYATAALAYDTVYIGSIGNRILAFDLHNGGQRWSYSTGGWVYSSPAVWRNLVFEGSYDHYFYALSAATGHLVWRFNAGAPISGSPTVLNGVVYVSSLGGHTWGLDARTGHVVWRFHDGRYSPVTADQGTIYLNGSHRIYALIARH